MRNIKTYEQMLSEEVGWSSFSKEYYVTADDGVVLFDLGMDPSLIRRDFEGSSLRGAELTHEDMTGADFSECDLRWASFNGSVLDGAIFTGANIEEVSFRMSSLKGAKGLETCKGILKASFQHSDLTDVGPDFFITVLEQSEGVEGFSWDAFFLECVGVPPPVRERIIRMYRGKSAFGM